MSSTTFKDGRCELCGKPPEHDNHHQPDDRPLLMRIVWPRAPSSLRHSFVDRDRRVRAAARMAELRRRRGRKP